MKISVIIVAYKNWKVLNDCLNSINKYNDIGSELEVIVVDNSPENERVKKHLETKLQYSYITNDNTGFGAGNNRGEEVATGDILAFLNPDTILIEPIFGQIIELFEKKENLAMCGIRLLNAEKKINSSFKYDYRSDVLSKQLNKIRNTFGIFNEKTMYIEGANIFIRHQIFISAGKFDENIFMYYEEGDLKRRVLQTFPNCHIEFVPSLHLIHLENGSTPNSEFAINTEITSCIYYGKKYSLNYKKKLQNELSYLKLKNFVYRVLKKNNQYQESIEVYTKRLKKL